jgi:amino acid transporter
VDAEPDFKPIRARLSTFDTAMVVFSLVLKIAMMVGLAVLALLLAPRARLTEPVSTAPSGLRLASALIPCFYAYGGYQLTMNLGADLKDARRRFPLGVGARVFTLEPRLAFAGTVILLTGWPLFRLGHTLFGPAGRST